MARAPIFWWDSLRRNPASRSFRYVSFFSFTLILMCSLLIPIPSHSYWKPLIPMLEPKIGMRACEVRRNAAADLPGGVDEPHAAEPVDVTRDQVAAAVVAVGRR